MLFKKNFPTLQYNGNDNRRMMQIIFDKAKIQYIPPCLRESAAIIEKAKKNQLAGADTTRRCKIYHSQSQQLERWRQYH